MEQAHVRIVWVIYDFLVVFYFKKIVYCELELVRERAWRCLKEKEISLLLNEYQWSAKKLDAVYGAQQKSL